MNKIALIARREFLTRVQKKTFLLTTILLPLLMFGFYAMMIYFTVSSGEKYTIAVADEANVFNGKIEAKDDISFQFLKNETPASLKAKIDSGTFDGYVYIPAGTNALQVDSIEVISSKSMGMISKNDIEDILNNRLEEQRLLSLNISKAQLDSAKKSSRIVFPSTGGSTDAAQEISLAVGYISGFLIYIVLLIYGTMVMRGVMEEKVSRIAEVIVSSVKPFQLMMGKIVGIGAVGLVQFIIWIILMMSLNFLLPVLFPGLMDHMQAQAIQPAGMQAAETIKSAASSGLLGNLEGINFPLIIGCFIFYFLGGYLLYSSLFAAVGSAVNEDPQDAQSLVLPVTMPIIFGIVIMMKAINDPGSGLAIFGSLFPLTSPIVMMARVSQGVPNAVPVWQLATSMLLLILGFLATTWLAAKIYRTGILMYGKKTTWKEMWKWAFRKG